MLSTELMALAENAGKAAALLKQLSNENRLMVLCTLMENELSVGELNEHIPLSQSALSQHLASLRDAGLVATRKEAQTVYYSIASVEAIRVITLLKEMFCPEP